MQNTTMKLEPETTGDPAPEPDRPLSPTALQEIFRGLDQAGFIIARRQLELHNNWLNDRLERMSVERDELRDKLAEIRAQALKTA